MVWAIVIAVIVHLFAYFIYKMGGEIFEAGNTFKYAVFAYLAVFTAAAIGMKLLIPSPGAADVMAIPQAWMDPVFAAE